MQEKSIDVDAGALARDLDGSLIRPGSPEYEAAREQFNGGIDNHPALIAQVDSDADVARAFEFAGENDLRVSIRGGGHGVAGVATSGELMIDLRRLDSVVTDAEQRLVHVGGGSVWGPVDVETQRHGLVTPGGRVTNTGVGGFTLGGGQGWLSPLYGLAADNLVEARVVTPDGRVLVASEEEDPDLLWALRGGGGGFGAVTSFSFRLHPLQPRILAGPILYAEKDAAEVGARYEEFSAKAPPEVSTALTFGSAAKFPFLAGVYEEETVVIVLASWLDDDLERGARELAPLRSLAAEPLKDLVGETTYVEFQASLDKGNPWGQRQYWSAVYMDGLGPDVIEASGEAIKGQPQGSSIIAQPMGAAVNAVPADATAFANREAIWLYHPLAVYDEPERDGEMRDWARGLVDRLSPFRSGSGSFINLSSDHERDELEQGLGETAFGRLQELRRRYDPDGVVAISPPRRR